MNRPARLRKHARRIAFMLAALALAGAAQAEWFMLGRSEVFRLYLDNKSISRNGDLAQIAQLMDFVTAQWVDARTVVGSIKMLTEYDCSKPSFRVLASEAYPEQMGVGRLVSTENFPDAQWETVEANTTPDKIRQIACGKK